MAHGQRQEESPCSFATQPCEASMTAWHGACGGGRPRSTVLSMGGVWGGPEARLSGRHTSPMWVASTDLLITLPAREFGTHILPLLYNTLAPPRTRRYRRPETTGVSHASPVRSHA